MPLHAEFTSKNPHTTAALTFFGKVADFEEAEKPSGVLHRLRAIGWKDAFGRPLPDLGGDRKRTLVKDGSDLFNGWTAQEKADNLRDARRAMSAAGIKGVNWRKLTLADML